MILKEVKLYVGYKHIYVWIFFKVSRVSVAGCLAAVFCQPALHRTHAQTHQQLLHKNVCGHSSQTGF